MSLRDKFVIETAALAKARETSIRDQMIRRADAQAASIRERAAAARQALIEQFAGQARAKLRTREELTLSALFKARETMRTPVAAAFRRLAAVE
jgi:hypothetical protein